MNIGIIGLGYWGPNLVRNAIMNDHIHKVYCFDRDESRLQKMKKTFDSVICCNKLEDILGADEIDSVAIVTPVETHYGLAKEALNHGKNILVEKPFMSSVAEAEEILELADRKGLITMVDHTFIYTSAVRKIKELIDSGELGELYYYDSVRVNLGLFQRDVNVIWDLAPHDFSIMNYLIGREPKTVQAMGGDHVGKGLEDVAYVHIDFGDNLTAHFHLNWLSPLKLRKTLLAGSKKMVVYDDMENSEKIKVYNKGIDVKTKEDEYKMLIKYRWGDMYSPALDNVEALQAMLQEFVDAVDGKRNPITSGRDGLNVVKILEATQWSIKNRGTVVEI
ncbi:MAG: Gfo/Idh/MocA family oxidoreductase [Flavobacteriales bacterium]|nr:Gfo/Idh/MocA family oxidoreductase [Flavobacteriales bacterium]